ncbi:MAG: peptidoglycan bridge formation glycyltransferase FemA/FemB family protein [Dehalococcoidia bacterium]|nr:peptidoglycan bridge formation glycyltransferase FemA/FemB family protein [Dehalococcoidia bacterium]
MKELRVDEREAWDHAVAGLPTGHILQSFEWGELKERFGWRSYRLLWESQGKVLGAALALRRGLPLSGLSIMYVPKGPCFHPEDTETLKAILRALKALARAEGAIFLKLDPDLTADHVQALAALDQEGFQPSREQVQLRSTMVVDLRPTEKEILARMNQSTRRNISLAQRNGVEVVEGGMEDLAVFYDLYRETARRDGFILRTYDYYQRLWRIFLEGGMARAFFARWQGEVLAGCLILRLGKKSWYLLGASRSQLREVRPNQLLQWEAMRWAKGAGAESYDMWGLPDVLEPGQPMWGLYQFKRGFGGELRRWTGAYDYIARPYWRSLWLKAFPLYTRLRGGTVSSIGGEGAAAGDGG